MDGPCLFICPSDHEFQRNPWAKVKEEFCPQCFSRGSFLDYYGEEIASLWDVERNDCSPEEYPGGRNTILHFICHSGHEFSRFPQGMKYVQGNLFPQCRMEEKAKSFPARNLLLSLWDHGRNESTPDEVSGKTRQRFWLLCPEGHSYKSQLRSLAAMGGCKFCLGAASTMEQEVKFFLESLVPDLSLVTGGSSPEMGAGPLQREKEHRGGG